jgi:hypothetical protein
VVLGVSLGLFLIRKMERDMNTHVKTGRYKSPKSPNPLPFNWLMPASSAGPCSRTFQASIKEREDKCPFDHISAYKVRESRENIESMISTVTEIIDVVSSGEIHSPPLLLGSCTSEDKAIWLKALPRNLAQELGYNLIPAVGALAVEGVPEPAINGFIQSIKEKVCQLLKDCDALQAATSRSINGEYALMKAGRSDMLRICKDALRIEDQASLFCQHHGVL